MRFIRDRAGLFAAATLLWHVAAVAGVTAAFSCSRGPVSAHATLPGHEGMADCPMAAQEPMCPLHADKHGMHDCDCPALGCAQTDLGLLALLGATAILPRAISIDVALTVADLAPVGSESLGRLAAVPPAPPPRA